MSITEEKLHKSRQKLLDLTLRNRLLNFRPGNPEFEDDHKAHKHAVLKGHLEKVWQQLVLDAKSVRVIGLTKDQQVQIAKELHRRSGRSTSNSTDLLPRAALRNQDWDEVRDSVRDVGGMLAKGSLLSLLPEEPFQKRLKRIRTEQNTLINSTGDSALFLAIGFLEWCAAEPHPKAGESIFAPLILVHSNLEENPNDEGGEREYFLRMDADQPQGNPCLVEMLRQDFGLDLPELGEEETAVEYLTRVGRALRNKKGWKVHDNIALGFFNFARYRLWLDLDPKVWPQGGGPADHAIVRSIVNGDPLPQNAGIPSDDEVATHQETKDLPLVLDSDSTQYAALLAAQNGVSIVIQGPPGSGKSQTITNLIAIAIAEGKRVLFVAQKLPALQVVQRRLRAVQIAPFCLPLFSDKARVTEVHKHLETSARMREGNDKPAPLFNRTVALAKKLNAHASRLREEPPGFSMSTCHLIQRAIALQLMLRSAWGDYWTDALLEIQAPVGDPGPDWLERREQTLHQWHRLQAEVGDVWTAWAPIKLGPMDPIRVEAVVRQLRIRCMELSGALACLPIGFQAMTVPQVDRLVTQLAQSRFTVLQEVLPGLLAFLWESPSNCVQVNRLERDLEEFKRHSAQANLVLRLSPDNRKYVADRSTAALRAVAPILSPKRSLTDAKRALQDLEKLLCLAGDLFSYAGLSSMGVCALVDTEEANQGPQPLAWKHVDLLIKHRTNPDLQIPLGGQLRLAQHVLDDKVKLGEARSYIQKLTQRNANLARLRSQVRDVAKLLDQDCLKSLDQVSKELSVFALGTLRLGEVEAFTGALVDARRALEAVAACTKGETTPAFFHETEVHVGCLLDFATLSGLDAEQATPPIQGNVAVLGRLDFSDHPAHELRAIASSVADNKALVEQLCSWFHLPPAGERIDTQLLANQELVANKLTELGLSVQPLRELPQLHEVFARLRKALEQAFEKMELVFASWPLLAPETLAQLQDAKTLFLLLGNCPPAPAELHIESLCSTTNADVIAAAIVESARLRQHQTALASRVSFCDVPKPDEVASTSRVLKSFVGIWWRWFSGDYRSARKAAIAYITPPFPADQELLALLDSLETYERQRRAFDHSPASLIIGGLFNGIETNWQVIEPTLNWLRTLKEATQIEQITPFVVSAIQHAEQLRDAARAVEVVGQLIELNQTNFSALQGFADVAAEPTSIRLKDLLAKLSRAEEILELVCKIASDQIDRLPESKCIQLAGKSDSLRRLDDSVIALQGYSKLGSTAEMVALAPEELLEAAEWMDKLKAYGVTRGVLAELASGRISINECQGLIESCFAFRKAIFSIQEFFPQRQMPSWASHQSGVASVKAGFVSIETAVTELGHRVHSTGINPHFMLHEMREMLAEIDEVHSIESDFVSWREILQEDPATVDPVKLTSILDWLEEIKSLGASGRFLRWLLFEESDSRFHWWQELIARAKALDQRGRSLQDSFSFPLRDGNRSLCIDVWMEDNANRVAQATNALETVESCSQSGDFTIQKLAEASSSLQSALELETTLARWQELLGVVPTSLETNHVHAHRQWVTVARTLPSTLADWLVNQETSSRCAILCSLGTSLITIKTSFNDLERTLNSFGKVSESGPFGLLNRTLAPNKIETCCQQFLDALPLLPTFAGLLREKESANKLGLITLLEGALRANISANLLIDTFHGALAHQQAKAVWENDDKLRLFRSSEQERLRERFQAEDSQQLETNREFIINRVSNSLITQGSKGRLARDHTEFTLLQFEMGKKRKHIPIRKLVQRAGRAMIDLCPCWMMTPTAVAQFLPPGSIDFDLVIMDEASQLNPEDAWGAISRGKQLLVVGDPKQMPPSDFFTSALEEDESPDEGEDVDGGKAESILEASMAALLSSSLLWHYRSKQESLIAPANSFSYDNRLVLFPHPHREHPELGIRYTYIPDAAVTMGKVTNSQEAAAIARRVRELVLREFAKSKDRLSIGVVTMNLPQQDCINDLLDKMRQDDRQFDFAMSALESESNEEPLFTRNLENIQGDERDVMILSCTYGPTKAGGTPAQRFGPLNREGGERRFNVLITRAKWRMEVFASIRSDQIIADGKRQGVQDFHLFLKYAESGVLTDAGRTTSRPADSPFEVQVEAVLLRAGFVVERQVGVAGYFIDLAVKHPTHKGLFALGIECDGKTYHSSRAARDRDRLRENVLRERGWKLHRIWSTDWFVNPEQAKARLISAVKAACFQAAV